MNLPTAKTTHKFSLASLSTLIYGPPKIGKSTFCSHADHALFLATEPGLNNLDVFQVPITTWEEFCEAVDAMVKGGHQYLTAIVDTVDNAYRFCEDWTCRKWGIKHSSDLAYGKGASLVNAEFMRVITKLASSPYGLIMTSHAKDKEVEARGGKYVKTFPTLPESARKSIMGFVDIILYVDIEVSNNPDGTVVYKRVVRTKPAKEYEAGDRTGLLPETIPLDYHAFASALQVGVVSNAGPLVHNVVEAEKKNAPAVEKVATTQVETPVAPDGMQNGTPAAPERTAEQQTVAAPAQVVAPAVQPQPAESKKDKPKKELLNEDQIAAIRELLPECGVKEEEICKRAKVQSLDQIPERHYDAIITFMGKEKAKLGASPKATESPAEGGATQPPAEQK